MPPPPLSTQLLNTPPQDSNYHHTTRPTTIVSLWSLQPEPSLFHHGAVPSTLQPQNCSNHHPTNSPVIDDGHHHCASLGRCFTPAWSVTTNQPRCRQAQACTNILVIPACRRQPSCCPGNQLQPTRTLALPVRSDICCPHIKSGDRLRGPPRRQIK